MFLLPQILQKLLKILQWLNLTKDIHKNVLSIIDEFLNILKDAFQIVFWNILRNMMGC